MSHRPGYCRLVLLSLFGFFVSCSRASVPTPGRDAMMQPRCAPRFEGEVGRLLATRGVAKTSTYFPSGEVQAQRERYPGELCPELALDLAVGALLTSNVPEALALVGAELGATACDARCFFDRNSSLFGIVADERSRLDHQLLPPSPRGGSVRDHWVFFLAVSDLSEHGYWALVARDGSGVRVVAEN